MANNEWREQGLSILGLSGVRRTSALDLPPQVRAALERTAAVPSNEKGAHLYRMSY